MTKNTTILDIAEAAEVSTATVSRVLNGSGKVKEATAKRVLRAADQMNYHPNRVARRMRTKSINSLVIGLIVPDMYNPFFSELCRAVEDVAFKYKHVTFICNTDEDSDKENFYIESMRSEKVSGLIIAPTDSKSPNLEKLAKLKFPTVCVDRKPAFENIDSCTIDSERGGYIATSRLIELGHKRIAIINGPRRLSTSKDRFTGYKKAMADAGLPLLDELVHFEDYKIAGGVKATRKLLKLQNHPTAIFSCNSLMTLGCISELQKQKISIPNDIALISYDEMPWSSVLSPPVTTIMQPCYELGSSAAELLIKKLRNPMLSATHIVFTPEIIIRESCTAEKIL